MKEKAILKFNSRVGALLCSGCRRIISTGNEFTEKEWMALQGKLDLPPQYCKDCREVSKDGNNETGTDSHELTAVEWLIDRFLFAGYAIPTEWKEQAKAMEKEQMYHTWAISEQWSDGKFLDSKKSFEQYYNETYS